MVQFCQNLVESPIQKVVFQQPVVFQAIYMYIFLIHYVYLQLEPKFNFNAYTLNYRLHSEGMGKVMFSPVSVCLYPNPAGEVPHLGSG